MKKIFIIYFFCFYGIALSQTKNIVKIERPSLKLIPLKKIEKDSLKNTKEEYKMMIAKAQKPEQYKILVAKPKDSGIALIKP